MTDNGIKEVFLQEAGELLERIELDIVSLEEQYSQEIVNELFRLVHTIKGSSGIAGFSGVSEFSHRLENLMDHVRSGKLEADREIVDILLGSVDWIRQELASGFAKGEGREIADELIRRMEEVKPGISDGAGAGDSIQQAEFRTERYYMVRASFNHNIFRQGIDPLILIEELCSKGEIVLSIPDRKAVPPLDKFDPHRCYLTWKCVIKTEADIQELRNIFLFADDGGIEITDVSAGYDLSETGLPHGELRLGEMLVSRGILTEGELAEAIAVQEKKNLRLGDVVVEKGYASKKEIGKALSDQEKIRSKIETGTVRVDAGKLDRLMNLLGEIVIGQSSISRISDEIDDEVSFRLKNALHGLDRTTREFQEQIMSIRMVPVGPTFEQFRRFVRDAALETGKEIQLQIEGRETELDKTVIEKIGDPLKHMIRNSIDHGIETSEERIASGKPAAGRISLRAYHQEGSVYIEIEDDGRGLNRKKLRERAIQKEMLAYDEDVTDSRLYSFIFAPGFSTAESVGALSGRGVGMDVVRTNIDSLRGVIEIDSREGEGTVFRIKLPLTMAIIDGMLVRVGREAYIVPLLSIVESMQPSETDVKTVEGKGEIIKVRGNYISLVRLHRLFGVDADRTEPHEALVVIVESGDRKIGIMVDDLLGQHQTVIKSLDKGITESRAISGAAILGDGSVALIIDIHGLIGELSQV